MKRITDFHTHVLPHMDDGSKSTDMTLEMLRRAADSGIERVVATPHFYGRHESVDHFLSRRSAAFERLSREDWTGLPALYTGAEVAYYTGITQKRNLEKLCIAGTNYMLLELPFREFNGELMDEVTTLALDRGFTLILAHLERYLYFDRDDWIDRMLELPLVAQFNAEALLSWRMRRKILPLLEEGQCLLGSDCHNLASRPPNLMKGRAVLRRKLGEDFLNRVDTLSAEILSQAQVMERSKL